MITNKTENRTIKVLEPGDKISCMGITCTIKEIKYQEYWGEGCFITEFFDTDGYYRSWKQNVDGGTVIPK